MISQRLRQLILRELDLEEWDLDEATTADTVPGWDSLNHARIITAVEEEFDVRFDVLELLRLGNLGELQALIDRKAP